MEVLYIYVAICQYVKLSNLLINKESKSKVHIQ